METRPARIRQHLASTAHVEISTDIAYHRISLSRSDECSKGAEDE